MRSSFGSGSYESMVMARPDETITCFIGCTSQQFMCKYVCVDGSLPHLAHSLQKQPEQDRRNQYRGDRLALQSELK